MGRCFCIETDKLFRYVSFSGTPKPTEQNCRDKDNFGNYIPLLTLVPAMGFHI
jgi:hypothetical protein